MNFRKIRTVGELSFEIKRTEEVIAFLRGADSITISAEWYDEHGQTKTKRKIKSAEIGEAVESILARRSESLRADLQVTKDLALRKQAGLTIKPATAEVWCTDGNWYDPYGVYGDFEPETPGYGNIYWARSPGSDTSVWFGDLPKETRWALWKIIDERGEEITGAPCSLAS